MKLMSIAPGAVIAATAAVEAIAVALDMNAIILAMIGLAGTSFMGYVSMKLAAIAAQAKENKVVSDKTSETMEKIHVAVNSKDTATTKKIDDMTETIKELSNTIKTLEEKLRGNETAKLVAEAARVPIVLQPALPVVQAMAAPVASTPPAAVPAPTPAATGSASPATKLDSAIDDLHVAAKEAVVATEKTEGLAGKFTPP